MNSLTKYLSNDRRSARRYDIKVPLHYRLRRTSTVEHTSESENLSELGAFFRTDIELRVGAVVDLLVELPIELNGAPMQWLYAGHVVRVERSDSLFARNRIGVQFDRYEILSPGCQLANLGATDLVPSFCIPRPVH